MSPTKSLVYHTGLVVVTLTIVAIPLFINLGNLPLQLWDESRLAISALEMFSGDGNILVPTIDYKPDMWSTKPPFLIWVQVLCLRLFGINEFALRFPSALSALLTCFFIYWFLLKHYKSHLPGLLAAIILVSSRGYVMLHGTRSADYDSTLVLFLTLYAGFFYLFIETQNKYYLYLTALFVTLAIFTKGIAGGFFIPALIIYAVYRNALKGTLKAPAFWLCTLVSLALVSGYYVLRERYTPGYFAAVQENELGGRFLKPNDGNTGGLLFFARNMVATEYVFWLPFLLLSFCCLPFLRLKGEHLLVFVVLIPTAFFLLLTASVTKLTWYSMPLYPFTAMVIAIFIYKTALFIYSMWKEPYARWMLTFSIIIICSYPYSQVLSRSLNPHAVVTSNKAANELAVLLKEKLNDENDNSPLKVIWDEYQGPITWYIKAAGVLKRPIEKGDVNNLRASDTVVTYQMHIAREIQGRYKVRVLQKSKYLTVFNIL